MNELPSWIHMVALGMIKFAAWYEFAKYKKQKMEEVIWFFLVLCVATLILFTLCQCIECKFNNVIEQLQKGVEIRKKETPIRVFPNTV